jgi:hypothetical protein
MCYYDNGIKNFVFGVENAIKMPVIRTGKLHLRQHLFFNGWRYEAWSLHKPVSSVSA